MFLFLIVIILTIIDRERKLTKASISDLASNVNARVIKNKKTQEDWLCEFRGGENKCYQIWF